MQNDKLILGGHEFSSRFILGSGKYSLKLIQAAVEYAGTKKKRRPLHHERRRTRNCIQFLPRPQIDLIYPMISPFALNTGSFSR